MLGYRRIRSGRGHRGHHGESLVARLRILYNRLYDPDGMDVHVDGRPALRCGAPAFRLITIANSDAAASSHTDAAMLEAHRAVQEVVQRRAIRRSWARSGQALSQRKPNATARPIRMSNANMRPS